MNSSDDNNKSITLTLTSRCNLNCTYCYEKGKSPQSMTFDMAKSIIDRELSEYTGKIYIELFGGEPFLEFELIKKIYAYLEISWNKADWVLFTTTNGTLVHGEIQNWLKSHPRLICGLSLDGNKQMHDINRSNSFDKIDLDFFVKTYPKQPVKMTISQETLPSLSDGVIFAHKSGFDVNCNLAFGIDLSFKDNTAILERELMKMINFYLENPTINPCSMLSFPIEHLGIDKPKATTKKWCGAGTHMKAYYIDGSAYPCQLFMPLTNGVGPIKKYGEIDLKEEISINELDEKCRNCKIIDACPTCYGSNYAATGNIYSKDDELCKLTKIIIKARSYFKAKQWEKGILKLDKKREQALLRSIALIQKNF